MQNDNDNDNGMTTTEPIEEAMSKETALLLKSSRTDVDITGMAYYEKIETIAPHIGDWYIGPGGQPVIIWGKEVRPITAEDAQYLLSKNAKVFFVGEDGKEHLKDPVDVRQIKNMLTWHDAPKIDRITSVPYFNSEWELVSTDGYDQVSKTYFIDRGIEIEEIDLETAKATLRYMCKSMLFRDPEVDYANYIGFLLIPMVQTALKIKMVPFHMFRKNQRGTGATTAVNVLGYLYYDEPVQSCSMPGSNKDDDLRKIITSSLRMGIPALNFDDLNGTLDRMPLVQYLTSGTWTDRKLQESTMLSFPNPAMLAMGTGNNVFIGGDIARRTCIIEFYTELEHPELRPMDPPNLSAFIRQNRGLILGSLAALVKNWSKVPGEDKIGDFKEWSTVVDGILREAGIMGFQANRNRISVLDVHADEMTGWLKGIYMWQQSRAGQQQTLTEMPFTATDLMTELNNNRDLKGIIPDQVADDMVDALNRGSLNKFSRQLGKMENQNRGGYVLKSEKNTRTGTKEFYIKKTGA